MITMEVLASNKLANMTNKTSRRTAALIAGLGLLIIGSAT